MAEMPENGVEGIQSVDSDVAVIREDKQCREFILKFFHSAA